MAASPSPGKAGARSGNGKGPEPDGPEITFVPGKFVYLLVPLVLQLIWLFGLVYTLPHLEESDKTAVWNALKPPNSLEDAKVLKNVLQEYSADNPVHVGLAISSLYIFMQCFAVPGTITLSLLLGALFGFARGLVLVCAVNLIGSSLCFAINTQVGRSIAYRLWPVKVKRFALEVQKRKGQMTNYMFFLRVTPFLPNTFINVASPVVNVPYRAFAVGSVLGCLPNNFMAIKAGMHLSELNSLSELYDPNSVMFLAGLGFLVMLPALLTKPPEFLTNLEEEKAKKSS